MLKAASGAAMIMLHFESHSTSADNEAGLASGQFDSPLSPRGQRQARQVGRRYRNVPLNAVFCSDLQRSWRTAEIAFARRKLTVIRDARLRECDYGEWTRRPAADLKAERRNRVTLSFPGGESYQQAAARMHSFLADLRAMHDGQCVLIVGHRATQYGLEHWIKGVPLRDVVGAPWHWEPGWTYVFDSLRPFQFS
jgi:broad specificity phosphatase PhoE